MGLLRAVIVITSSQVGPRLTASSAPPLLELKSLFVTEIVPSLGRSDCDPAAALDDNYNPVQHFISLLG